MQNRGHRPGGKIRAQQILAADQKKRPVRRRSHALNVQTGTGKLGFRFQRLRVQTDDFLRLIDSASFHAHIDRAVCAGKLQEPPAHVAALCKLRAVSADSNDCVAEQ